MFTNLAQGASTSVPNFVPPCHHHFSIPPYQYKNERDFFLPGIYTSACHIRMSVDMISSLLFINSHYRVIPPEKYIDLFEGSIDHIQDQINDMYISVDCSN